MAESEGYQALMAARTAVVKEIKKVASVAEMIEGESDYNRDCVEMIVRVYAANSEGHVVARNLHFGVGSQETAEDAAASYRTLRGFIIRW